MGHLLCSLPEVPITTISADSVCVYAYAPQRLARRADGRRGRILVWALGSSVPRLREVVLSLITSC